MTGAGLDHIVHAVRDLDATAAFYERLGFQVGARNRHPRGWGTQNHIVQLPGTFIELLAVTDSADIAPHAPGVFSFGAFNRDFLTRGQGLSMLVLEGRDGDAEHFGASGIGEFAPYYFERKGKRPDGTIVTVAFTLAFARDDKAPDVGFFTCKQHYPENFWNSAFQHHANEATSAGGIVLVADDPAQHCEFLAAFAHTDKSMKRGNSFLLTTVRGTIEVMTPSDYSSQFDIASPHAVHGARLAAIRFQVEDLARAGAIFDAAKIPRRSLHGRIVVGPEVAMGATLVFETMNFATG